MPVNKGCVRVEQKGSVRRIAMGSRMYEFKRKAAHFLLTSELACSPPNEAIVGALLELGFAVDLFAPGGSFLITCYDERVTAHSVEYGRRWLSKYAWSHRWSKYSYFSGTSEDPLAVAGILSWLHRRPLFALVDEIKSGSYCGDSSESWKKLCRWAIRRAKFNVVNDEARISLLREYAGISPDKEILVYPGCFREPPAPADRSELRRTWGIPDNALVLAVSGGFNVSCGADWLIQAVQQNTSLYAVIQPVNLDSFTRFLLNHVQGKERIYIEERRLSWSQSWESAAGVDIGLAIYHNQAPQFQNMGMSSNRLCMFLAMGVPVIGNKQKSFEFLESYDCGIMVDSYQEFLDSIDYIQTNAQRMKKNCLKCVEEYIMAGKRFEIMKKRIDGLASW